MMFKFFTQKVRLASFVSIFAVAALSAAPAHAELKILVVDQQAILQNSLAGKDMARQAAALRTQISKEVEAEQKAIIAEEQSLQANAKVLSPAQREEKAKAITDRRRAYPLFEQRKGQVLQLSLSRASNEIAVVLQPLLQQLVEEKKADLVIDRQVVLYAAETLDITKEATQRLNQQLKTVKLERVSLDAAPAQEAPAAKN